MFNKVILMGRICNDLELKTTQSGLPVVSFRLAVNRKVGKDSETKTDFIDIVAWRTTATFTCTWFTKGKPMLVCGSLQVREWEDKQGGKRRTVEVVADEVSFTGDKGGQPAGGQEQPKGEYVEIDIDDDSFPF